MPYKTVLEPASDSLIIEKSEFIAKISPAKTSEEAAAFIDSVRSEHRRARHNCYAYTLREGFETRFSDDGEPQGTAGQPILEVIQKSGLSDVCVVVTRYFGGILLGKGGLTRAYSSSAAKAVAAAKIRLMNEAKNVTAVFDYSLYERILRLLPEFEVKTVGQDFSDSVTLNLLVKDDIAESFCLKLKDVSNGKIKTELSETFFADFA